MMNETRAMERTYTSVSAEVKQLIMDSLKDGAEHERKEIVAYISEHVQNKEVLTDGIIAGSFKMLLASGGIKNVSRAIYQKGTPVEMMSIKEKVLGVFRKFRADLDKVCTVNMLYATPEDIEAIKAFSDLSNLIESEIWKIEDGDSVEPQETTEKPETVEKPENMEKKVESPKSENKPKPGTKNLKEKVKTPEKPKTTEK